MNEEKIGKKNYQQENFLSEKKKKNITMYLKKKNEKILGKQENFVNQVCYKEVLLVRNKMQK